MELSTKNVKADLPEHMLKLFKSRPAHMGYVFRDGTNVHFIDHEYKTNRQSEIDELTEVCNEGGTTYYIDPEQTEISSIKVDPLAALTAKIREEERVKLLLSMERDMGETKHTGKLEGIANSSSIRGASVASNTQAPVGGTATAVATKH